MVSAACGGGISTRILNILFLLCVDSDEEKNLHREDILSSKYACFPFTLATFGNS